MYLYNQGVTRVKRTRDKIIVHNTNSNKDYLVNEDTLKILVSAVGNLTVEEASKKVTGDFKNNKFFSTIENLVKEEVLGYSEKPRKSKTLYREDFSSFPLNLTYIEPTSRCNLECIHCFNSSPKKEGFAYDMNEKLIEEVIDIIDRKGVMEVCLTGGEIMCHPYALEIMEKIRDRGIKFGILTNGSLLDEEKIQRIKNLKPSFITVSLDSHIESIHNYIRKRDCFKDVIKNIEKMVELGLNPKINYTLFSGLNDSLYSIKGFLNYVSNLGIDFKNITFDEFCPEGRGLKYSNYVINEKEAINNLKIAYKELFKKDLKETKSVVLEDSFCGIGIDACCIKSDGSVTPCPAIYGNSYNLGNVRDLDKIWEQSEFFELLRKKEYLKNQKCNSCNSLKLCLGGCRRKALTFNGDINSYDPWMCAYLNEQNGSKI